MLKKIALVGLCLAGTAAQAADNGFYLGAGVSRTDFGLRSALDKTDTGYKAIAGLRLLDSLGVELNYADHGEATLPSGIACIALVGADCPATSTVDAKTTSAFAVGFLDFPLIDLFGKAGLSYTDTSLRTPGVAAFGASENRTDFAWGAGVQAHFLSFAVRAEFERFEVLGHGNLDVMSASLIYTFL